MPTVKNMVVDWLGELKFSGRNEKGLKVDFEIAVEDVESEALSPMETLLASLGACSSYYVATILKKQRQNLKGLSVKLTGIRRDEPPRIYTEIDMKYMLRGLGLNRNLVENAVRLSNEKYCSVGGMLGKAAKITYSYEIIEEK
jgi:putative redox protein